MKQNCAYTFGFVDEAALFERVASHNTQQEVPPKKCKGQNMTWHRDPFRLTTHIELERQDNIQFTWETSSYLAKSKVRVIIKKTTLIAKKEENRSNFFSVYDYSTALKRRIHFKAFYISISRIAINMDSSADWNPPLNRWASYTDM